MRSNVLRLLAAIALTGPALLSAAEPSRTSSSKPSAAESEDASGHKRASFFTRLFGGRQKDGEPARPSASPEKKTSPAPAQKQDPSSDAKADPKAELKPAPKKAALKDKAQEPPKTEEERFEAARKTAAEDAKIAELRTKAEASPNNAESNRLMRSYLHSLYGKMRTLEPTLSERIDLTEKAALKLVPEAE